MFGGKVMTKLTTMYNCESTSQDKFPTRTRTRTLTNSESINCSDNGGSTHVTWERFRHRVQALTQSFRCPEMWALDDQTNKIGAGTGIYRYRYRERPYSPTDSIEQWAAH
jgi:hypothetical protein